MDMEDNPPTNFAEFLANGGASEAGSPASVAGAASSIRDLLGLADAVPSSGLLTPPPSQPPKKYKAIRSPSSASGLHPEESGGRIGGGGGAIDSIPSLAHTLQNQIHQVSVNPTFLSFYSSPFYNIYLVHLLAS